MLHFSSEFWQDLLQDGVLDSEERVPLYRVRQQDYDDGLQGRDAERGDGEGLDQRIEVPVADGWVRVRNDERTPGLRGRGRLGGDKDGLKVQMRKRYVTAMGKAMDNVRGPSAGNVSSCPTLSGAKCPFNYVGRTALASAPPTVLSVGFP